MRNRENYSIIVQLICVCDSIHLCKFFNQFNSFWKSMIPLDLFYYLSFTIQTS